MPTIDLGSVVGPQGPQGATGATGATGAQGAAGPNQVSATTSTTLTGVLCGANSVIGTIPVDSTANASHTGNLVSSAGVANGIAYAKSTCVNPNLLDNWCFVGGGTGSAFPVNQRGNTQYSGGSTKAFDRWGFGSTGGQVDILSTGIKLTLSSSGMNLYQYLDVPYAVLAGQRITVSALNASGHLYTASGTFPATEPSANTTIASVTYENVQVRLLYSATSGKISFGIAASSASVTVTIVAAKLELGDTQTLCHNTGTDANPVWVLNEIPNYGEQLARCQRYLYPFYGDGYRASIITANLMFCILPTSLRNGATVTIVNDSLAVKSMAGAAQTGFAFSLTGVSRNGKIEVQASKTSHGLTDGSLYSSGTTLFSAEL